MTKREPTTTFQPRNAYERQVMESAKAAVKLAYDQGYKDGEAGQPRPVSVTFHL
jgi:hypothetical protein